MKVGVLAVQGAFAEMEAYWRGQGADVFEIRQCADLVRGMEVSKALGVLKYSTKEASGKLEKLLRSAIANWEQKTARKADEVSLYVKTITVDGGRTLKRLRPAPQGRGYRIRKRSNHVTIAVDTKPEENK